MVAYRMTQLSETCKTLSGSPKKNKEALKNQSQLRCDSSGDVVGKNTCESDLRDGPTARITQVCTAATGVGRGALIKLAFSCFDTVAGIVGGRTAGEVIHNMAACDADMRRGHSERGTADNPVWDAKQYLMQERIVIIEVTRIT